MNGDDRCFVDSNVLLYAHDSRNQQKQRRAEAWLDWLWQNAFAPVSWQVLQEFYSNATFEMRVPPHYAGAAVKAWSEWHPPEVTLGLLERAWFWSDQAELSFWDSMIVTAAERSRCRWLLSEDFQAGRQFGAVTVVDPFRNQPATHLNNDRHKRARFAVLRLSPGEPMRSSILLALILPVLGVAQTGASNGVAVVRSANGTLSATATIVARQSVTTGQPYSCEQISQHTQTLNDGTNIADGKTIVRMYRDSAGRTRTERPLVISPAGADGPEAPMMIEISDPVAGYRYMLDTSRKTVHRSALPAAHVTAAAPLPANRVLESRVGTFGMVGAVPLQAPPGSRPARPEIANEDLGTKSIDGNLAEGRRTTMTFAVGSIGNDRPVVVTNETWFSTELRLALLTTNHDPRHGDNITSIENLSRTEPDPSLFQIPSDYEVADDSGPMMIQAAPPPPPPAAK